MPAQNLDQSYQDKAYAYNLERARGPLGYYRAHYQGTGQAFKLGFYDGAVLGAGVGSLSAIYYRQFLMAPKFSLAGGLTLGTIMMISQFYRFEL
mmetsp:Transcript_13919/g.23683  ORF Transcript_13919/g.23683 Transcript_13919/m.23683 type:complete len:94 (-) Transcript_13919:50-331(-)|eukprot:CAMPEP_0168607426 /NCGR_PEP_ID=MMETSP0449_2-20121227/34_1 /TAXON_ID=1082188 /ORGANISM="Strombidium rassoulzadegani, Strain ras09" /LENGTH=93 /DNA_ID=CAMNT_0008647237 /DNA_START=277 /DNA_END=558 /DNA_ORIENTATION=+